MFTSDGQFPFAKAGVSHLYGSPRSRASFREICGGCQLQRGNSPLRQNIDCCRYFIPRVGKEVFL